MPNVNRKDPCHCGSGLKFKRCHGEKSGSDEQIRFNINIGYPFDPIASMLERSVRPNLLTLKKTALIEWCGILDQWVIDDASHNDSYDTIRLERLINFALGNAQTTLSKWDPRFSLQVTRSLPHSVIADISQLSLDDTRQIVQIIRSLNAVASTAKGIQWHRSASEGQTAICLTPKQLRRLERQMPDVIGRLIGACNLLVWSQFWYRWAGKGRKIASVPQRLSQQALDSIRLWNGQGIFRMPVIELAENDSIEQAAANYDARREREQSGICRAGFLKPQVAPEKEPLHRRIWDAILCSPGKRKLPVHIPKLDITFPSPNWYPTPNTSWIPKIRFLGRYFDPQLRAVFKLSAAELELCLAAFGLVIERQTQCGYLAMGDWKGIPALVLSSPADSSALEGASSHLFSILQRGTVRVQGVVFRNAIIWELDELGVTGSISLAERFFEAFSGRPNPREFAKPFLFCEQDEQTCVHDLTCWPDFWEGLMAAVTSENGSVANSRGSIFEKQVRERLIESLSLTDADIPWMPNREVWVNDKNFGDVDFCFLVQNVLINLDMKSWQRSSDYHVGHFHTVQQRQKDLIKQLGKVERRGEALYLKLKEKGLNYIKYLNFLIVATPEYLDPSELSLWYGSPPKRPRVITVDELCDLVSDVNEFNATLDAAN
jgi:hypothetical protein